MPNIELKLRAQIRSETMCPNLKLFDKIFTVPNLIYNQNFGHKFERRFSAQNLNEICIKITRPIID